MSEESFNSKYSEICNLASSDDRYFDSFRSNSYYTEILEHVSPGTGMRFIEHSIQKNNQKFDQNVIDILKSVDYFGGPTRFNFPNIGNLSPTMFRYYSIVGDIERLHGKLTNKKVVEIGCGYGGQAMMLDLMHGVGEYIIIDLPEVLTLIKKFLNKNNIDISKYKFFSHLDLPVIESDYVISNYAFSEVGIKIQDIYLDRIINKSKNFYMTINRTDGCYSNSELLEKLTGNISVVEEEPLQCSSNFLFYK